MWGFSMPQNIARGRRGGGNDDDVMMTPSSFLVDGAQF